MAVNADQGRRDIFFNNTATGKSLLQITLDPYYCKQPQLKPLGYGEKKGLKVKGRQTSWEEKGTAGMGRGWVDTVRIHYTYMYENVMNKPVILYN